MVFAAPLRCRPQGTLVVALLLFASMYGSAAQAQEQQAGQVAKSSAGQVGRRQTREEAAAKINPLAAVNGRLQNRVESRLRTRIDRYYDPQANTLSPFKVAGEETRIAGRPRRR